MYFGILGQLPSRVWATSLVDITDDGLYVADSIRNRDALAASDGSYDNDCSAAACVIEGALSHYPRILCQTTTPGPTQIHDAYQGKLTDLYMIVSLVELLCTHQNINSVVITVACDGIQALLKGFDPNTSLTCQSSQQDLIRSIWTRLQNSPMDWKWQHVKGHQDDVKGHKEKSIEPLDHPATLNVEMDNNAKAH